MSLTLPVFFSLGVYSPQGQEGHYFISSHTHWEHLINVKFISKQTELVGKIGSVWRKKTKYLIKKKPVYKNGKQPSLQRLSSLKIISLNFTKVSMSCLEEKLNNKNTLQFWCFKISFRSVRKTKISSVFPQPSSRRAVPNRNRIGTM